MYMLGVHLYACVKDLVEPVVRHIHMQLHIRDHIHDSQLIMDVANTSCPLGYCIGTLC